MQLFLKFERKKKKKKQDILRSLLKCCRWQEELCYVGANILLALVVKLCTKWKKNIWNGNLTDFVCWSLTCLFEPTSHPLLLVLFSKSKGGEILATFLLPEANV